MYKTSTFYDGEKVRIMAIVEVTDTGREIVYIEKFINDLTEQNRRKVVAFIKKVGDNGFPRNREKMKKLQSYKFFELRIFSKPQVRIFCMPNFEDKQLILIDGEIKKSRKINRQKLDRIQSIWNKFQRQEEE